LTEALVSLLTSSMVILNVENGTMELNPEKAFTEVSQTILASPKTES
jgi:hypothetical protein